MPTLADLLNSPGTIEYKGKTYSIRQPLLPEEGEYQRQLEAEARASAARATELPEEDRRNLLRDVNADIASGRFAWGGEECVRSLRNPDGIARLWAIVGREQGVSYPLAREMVQHRLKEIAALLVAAEAGDDPKKKAELRQLLTNLGLPANFLSTSSSASPTSTGRKRSPHLGVSRAAKSKLSTPNPKGTRKAGKSSRR